MYTKSTEANMQRRMHDVSVLSKKIETTPGCLPFLWTSDEAHCYLDGHINSKKQHILGPDIVSTKQLHSKKVTVRVALSEKEIIGPLFFVKAKKCSISKRSAY